MDLKQTWPTLVSPSDANVGLLATAMIGPYVYNGFNWVGEGLLDLN